MTLDVQLLLIFQFPGLSNPLANPVSCAHGEVAFLSEDRYGCGPWPQNPDGPFLLLPGQTAQILGSAVLLLASFLQPGFLT